DAPCIRARVVTRAPRAIRAGRSPARCVSRFWPLRSCISATIAPRAMARDGRRKGGDVRRRRGEPLGLAVEALLRERALPELGRAGAGRRAPGAPPLLGTHGP